MLVERLKVRRLFSPSLGHVLVPNTQLIRTNALSAFSVGIQHLSLLTGTRVAPNPHPNLHLIYDLRSQTTQVPSTVLL